MKIQFRIWTAALFILSLLILSAGSLCAQEVQSKVNEKQDFSKYRKYAWRKLSIGNSMTPDEVQRVEQMIKNAGNRELAQKGYQEDSANPDFFIEISTIGVNGVNMGGKAGYLYTYSGEVQNPQYGYAPGTDVWMTLTSRGSLVVTDSKTNTVVWQAQTYKEYKNPGRAMKNIESEVNGVVKKAMKSLPANQKGK